MGAHWSAAVEYEEGAKPDRRCYRDPKDAAAWLDGQLGTVERRAERAGDWEDAIAIRDARREGHGWWSDLSVRQDDPADNTADVVPTVVALGTAYTVTGCRCGRQEAIEVADVLGLMAEDARTLARSAQAAATLAAVRTRTVKEAWLERTRTENGHAGGVVPILVSMHVKAAETAQQHADDLERQHQRLHARADQQRDAAAWGATRVCGASSYHKGGGCGIPARVSVRQAYYDSDDCTWCGKSDITHRLGD